MKKVCKDSDSIVARRAKRDKFSQSLEQSSYKRVETFLYRCANDRFDCCDKVTITFFPFCRANLNSSTDCCVISTVSADVTQPEHAKQSKYKT